ncbi:MAG: hypothetical protein STHCBS139747_008013 [Sporothrix thermara]
MATPPRPSNAKVARVPAGGAAALAAHTRQVGGSTAQTGRREGNVAEDAAGNGSEEGCKRIVDRDWRGV